MLMKMLILKETVALPGGGGLLYDYETDQSKFKKPFGIIVSQTLSCV